jgi:hypothetical protein
VKFNMNCWISQQSNQLTNPFFNFKSSLLIINEYIIFKK